jgi:hypothetical protein
MARHIEGAVVAADGKAACDAEQRGTMGCTLPRSSIRFGIGIKWPISETATGYYM